MSRITAVIGLSALLAAGCNGDAPEELLEDACDNTFTTYPESGASNVYYRTAIEASFAKADDTATIAVTGPDGDVSGTPEWVGTKLLFHPDGPLDPSAPYTIDVGHACGSGAIDFTTSEVGATVTTDGMQDDNTSYVLDLASGRFVEPAGVGPLLQQYVTVDILVDVQAIDGTELQMEGAIALEGSDPPVQDECVVSIPFPPADFTANPYFLVEGGGETVSIEVEGYSVNIQNLIISGAFSPAADYISGAVLAGVVDTRDFVYLVDPSGEDQNAICSLAQALGVYCDDCGAGDPYCLSLYVDNIAADGAPSPVVPRLSEEICFDDECGVCIAGLYIDEHGVTHEIDDNDWKMSGTDPEADPADWSLDYTFVSHSNTEQWVAVSNVIGEGEDEATVFGRFQWAWDDAGDVFFCQTADGLPDALSAEATSADDEDLEAGCLEGPWTNLTP